MEDAPEFTVVTEALAEAPPSLVPVPGREEPAVWVERLAIYKTWPPTKDSLLRQVVELRRGLNIIWARPIGKNPAASRLAGHSAGKSTFCRLLRYVLDDATSGTDDFRKRFEAKFGIGWALAEVHVAGARWLVGRPIAENAAGYHSFAYKDGTLTQEFPERPPRLGYREYCTAIDDAVFGKMSLRTLPGSQRKLDWPQLIQWLGRDQEAHFSGLLEWRNSGSESESVSITADDRANLVRLVLGLVQQTEEPLLKEYAKKAADHESKVRERVKLEFAIERDRKSLEIALKTPVGKPTDPVLQLEIANQVANLRNQADTAVKAATQDEATQPLLDTVATTQAEYEVSRVIADDAKMKVDVEDSRLKGVTPPPAPKGTGSSILKMIQGLEPFHGYCSHPIDAAYRAKCPIAKQRTPDDQVKQATEELKQTAPAIQSELERLKAEHQRHEGVAQEKKRAWESAQALFNAARVRQRMELEALKEPAKQAATIEALHESFVRGCNELEQMNKDIKGLASEKDAINESLEALTKLHKELLGKFARLFRHIGQHMLDKAVTGSVEFSGKSIQPRLEYNGDRDSAALKVTKWVMFDFAALVLGITTTDAHHPRFLMHDSPRESDMAPLVYGGLFQAAKEIEGAFGEKAPFQYIVTTTEPPPADLCKAPWLRLELDASIEGERFLGVNL